MAKYDPLTAFLKKTDISEVPMSFEEVARIIAAKLPPSAYRHRPWWANETTGHVHAKSWLNAGYETTQVDMESKKLIFKRLQAGPSGMAEDAREFQHTEPKSGRHPLIGAMKGTFTIEPGFDLTSPMFDPDELAEWEANLDRTADMIEEGMSSKRR
jgi:hypothetical protein